MEELTKKQRGFVKDYVETGNATQAAKNNYDVSNDLTARVIGSENLTKPNIQKAINSIADKIPDDLLERVHIEGLQASRTIKAGEEDYVEPDYAVRHKYLDSAYKLKGAYAPDKNINMNVSIKSIDPTDPKVLEAIKIINKQRANE